MIRKALKYIVILVITLVFAVSSGLAMAAEKQWFVIKDSRERCSVIQAKAATPKTIAGPFATKDQAQKAKEEKCPKVQKKKKS
jgi:hypothetical protein